MYREEPSLKELWKKVKTASKNGLKIQNEEWIEHDSMFKKFSQWSEKLLWIKHKVSIIWYEPFKVSHATYIIWVIQEIYTYLNGVKSAQYCVLWSI